MEFTEFTGKTVDDAVINAAATLGVTTDNIEYEVIEKGSSGLLGLIGSKPAKIKARKKEAVAQASVASEANTVAQATQAAQPAKTTQSDIAVEEVAKDFLEKTFKAMNLEVEIKLVYDEVEGTLDIDLVGPEMGLLIGKRGQTLDSLQYLVSLVVNKNQDKYVKVKLDTEDYRRRRKETLESLAKNIAFKVKRSRRSVSLEPMNPYERRIIHAALQNDKFVTTKSEGEDPFRHVVVMMKPGVSKYSGGSSYSKYGSGNRYSKGGYSNKRRGSYSSDKKETTEVKTEE